MNRRFVLLFLSIVLFGFITQAEAKFIKIANDGSVLADSAKLGSAPKDWACTKDDVSGLIWEVKANDKKNPRDRNKSSSWVNVQTYLKETNKNILCAADDWRIPTKQELMDLVPKPPLNSTYFGDISLPWFWSSDESGQNAWIVDLSKAKPLNTSKAGVYSIRLVREDNGVTTPPDTPTIPDITEVKASPIPVVLGNSVTFSATLSDSLPSGYSVKLTYGKNIGILMTGSGNNYSVSNKPSALGIQSFLISIYDSAGKVVASSSGNDTFEVIKANTAPKLSLVGSDKAATTGVSYTVKLSAKDSDKNLKNIIINWGDGNSDNLSATDGTALVFLHIYSKAGTYTWSAIANDTVGASSVALSKGITVVIAKSGNGSGSTTKNTIPVNPISAFNVQKQDGTLVSWGNKYFSQYGSFPTALSKLTNVKQIYKTTGYVYAFAALLNDNSVITYGTKKGDIAETGNQMDIAIKGNGFFPYILPDGTVIYSRDGQLKLDLNGQIVNANGLPLTPVITIPQDALSILIGTDGMVSIMQPNNPTPVNVGQIQIANFANISGLEKDYGQGYFYRASKVSGTPTVGIPGKNGIGSIVQNSLEIVNIGGDTTDVANQLKNITEITANSSAFAALRKDGSVVTWGDDFNGGDSRAVASQLNGKIPVTKIFANEGAFAALRNDGSVVTWGHGYMGGNSSAVATQLNGKIDVKQIYSNNGGDFVALRADNSVVIWGSEITGKQLDIGIMGEGFLQVLNTDGTVAYTRDGQLKLDENGQLVSSGGLPLTPSISIPIDALSITIGTDGTVTIWQPENPQPSNVGAIELAKFNNPSGLKSLGNNLYAQSSSSGMPAIGTAGQGGFGNIIQNSLEVSSSYDSIIANQLNGKIAVKQIYSSALAYAALRSDGSVVTWGDRNRGGDSSKVSKLLNGNIDVVDITSNNGAFAALRADGSVVTWGNGLQYDAMQGNVEQTGNQLDIAINGRGFLQVSMPDGSIAYTRNGQLKLDDNGQIVNANGLPLNPSMTIPQDALSITIGTDGTVSVLQPGNPQPSNVGQIQTANFINLSGLEPIGKNLYRESAASGPPIIGTPGQQEFGAIVQNSLEQVYSSGDSSDVALSINGTIDVKKVYANRGDGFLALRTDGSIVHWGTDIYDSTVNDDLDKKVLTTQIFSNNLGFAALKNDGSVVAWSTCQYICSNNSDFSAVSNKLNGRIPVKDIRVSDFAFAALRSDGSVVTWGDKNNGGDSSTVANKITSGVVGFHN